MNRSLKVIYLLIMQGLHAHAQQFTAASGPNIPGVSQMSLNPAWVNSAIDGIEIQPVAVSGMAGTNAYLFSNTWVTGGFTSGASEGEEYMKNYRSRKNRHLWGNLEIVGPSVAFPFKKGQALGIFTRMRQVTRGGNLSADALGMIGGIDPAQQFPDTIQFENAGFSTHVFGELGLTYGRILNNDGVNVLKGGVTIKYLTGMAAGTLYTPSATLDMGTGDSVRSLTGDVTVLYSANALAFADNDFGNDISSWFDKGGGGSVGFDLGMQYEYHPGGDPNRETPYLYRVSASITDIGSIPYTADTTSGAYTLKASNNFYWQLQRRDNESIASYFEHLEKDSIVMRKDSFAKFRMGLPTAFRLNGDINISHNFWASANIVLNLRGDNGEAYRPAYVNMLNLTPRYENKWLAIGLPFTFWGYENLTAGVALRVGPLYLGSVSILSNLMNRQIRNVDAYVGLAFKIKKSEAGNEYNYYR